MAEQHRGRVAANCLWPQTLIATAAVSSVVGGETGMRAARVPDIIAGAAAVILSADPSEHSGRCHVVVLCAVGQAALSVDAAVPGVSDDELELDRFV